VNPSEAKSRAFAFLFARLVLGLIFFMAGGFSVDSFLRSRGGGAWA
jgi:hypothetical protein